MLEHGMLLNFNACIEIIPTTDSGPKTAEGILAPTPRTEEGGAAPSQKVGPGLLTALRGAFTPAPVR